MVFCTRNCLCSDDVLVLATLCPLIGQGLCHASRPEHSSLKLLSSATDIRFQAKAPTAGARYSIANHRHGPEDAVQRLLLQHRATKKKVIWLSYTSLSVLSLSPSVFLCSHFCQPLQILSCLYHPQHAFQISLTSLGKLNSLFLASSSVSLPAASPGGRTATMATVVEQAIATTSDSVCSDSGPTSATSTVTTQSGSTTMSRNSSQTSIADLPASAYDGSHLHWKAFRQHVLAPHRIRILENPPKGHLPDSFLSLVEAQSINTERFSAQKHCFREQVNEGRGFGPSPLFPPNLLPTIEEQPQLARCMVPSFSREALPERALNHAAPMYELGVPRPGLGCGFSSFAFSDEDIISLPSYLVGTGTCVDFSTGYISPSHAVYCPFLIFERAFGTKEHRLEAANNQCAIGGAYCCHALQMLYAEAYKAEWLPAMPIAFSCTVDNDFAIINYHWIDHEQGYYMAPLCKFDLRQDEHFSHFAAWVEAIGQWAVAYVLPQIKEALVRLRKRETPSPGYIEMKAAKKLTLLTESNKNDLLIKSLKTTFDTIPWKFEDDEFTPVSSSTASWGSPMVDDMLFANLTYPHIPKGKGIPITLTPDEQFVGTPRRSLADIRMAAAGSPPVKGTATPPPAAYTNNPNLVSHRRVDHAMDEIRDLHTQLEAMKTYNADFRKEIIGLRNTLSSVLRKESATVRKRSLLSRRVTSPDYIPSSPTDSEPAFPLLRAPSQPQLRHRRPEMLQINTVVGAPPSSSLKQSTLPGDSPPPPPSRCPPTLTLSCNGVDVVLSPTNVKRTPLSRTPCFDSHKSPLLACAPPWTPRTPITAKLSTLPPSPPPTPRKTNIPWYLQWYQKSTPQAKMALRWACTLVSGYMLVALVPYNFLAWVVVGYVADCAVRSIVSVSPVRLGLRGTLKRPALLSKGKEK